jgi:hypothetical protein
MFFSHSSSPTVIVCDMWHLFIEDTVEGRHLSIEDTVEGRHLFIEDKAGTCP